jgi:ABC-2 type transport system permease protein
MRNTFKLAFILLKSGGLFGGGKNKKKQSRWLLPALLVFAFLSFGFSVGAMAMGMYEALESIGQQGALLPLAFGATSAVIFLFGIFYVISVMYHADDIPVLLYLPLRPYQILGAKLVTLIVYEYIFEAFILVPVLVTYAIKAAAGPLFILYSALLALAAPVVPLCIAAALIMVIMRFTRFAKNKQAFNFVSGILAMVIAVGFNVLLQTNIRHMMENPGAITSLIPVLNHTFPGVRFASGALIGSAALSGLWNLLLYLLCAAAGVAVFLLLGQLLYFKGVAGVTETSAKRRAISAEELAKETAGTPVLWSYTRKELRLLFRTPIAFLNCVLINFIWPLLLLFMMFSGTQSMDSVRAIVEGAQGGAVLAVLVGASAFIASSNAITSSALSREGRNMYFMKYIPVSMRRQLYAKTLTGMLLSLIGIVLMCGIALYLGAPVLIAAIALVMSIPAVLAACVAGILIDAARPKLEWTNEQQAIKQNMNVLLHMLFGLVFALAVILPALLIRGLSLFVTVCYIIAVIALSCALTIRGVKRSAQKIVAMDV